MTWRAVQLCSSVIVFVIGLSGCSDLTGPKAEEGRFGIGTPTSFVTTGGASGDLSDITFIVDLFTQRMSFNAKGGADASGVFNFTGKIFGVNTHIHGEIVCYAIDGNKARVAGHITSADPPVVEDVDAIWTVEDNGEGSKLTPDRISLYSTVPHAPGNTNCLAATALEPTMYNIETGNVQVHF
jgi:hypothetical protein